MLFNLEDWENSIHFGNLFASIGKKNILFGFGNENLNRSRFYREKNHCFIITFFLSLDTDSINFDHHIRCSGWLNFEFS